MRNAKLFNFISLYCSVAVHNNSVSRMMMEADITPYTRTYMDALQKSLNRECLSLFQRIVSFYPSEISDLEIMDMLNRRADLKQKMLDCNIAIDNSMISREEYDANMREYKKAMKAINEEFTNKQDKSDCALS